MPGISDLMLGGLLILGSHEMGHEIEADMQNAPISWDGIRGRIPTNDKRKLSRIAGAGFDMQDKIGRALEGKSPAYNLASAIEKLSYLGVDRGDLATLEKAKGKDAERIAKAVLLFSALADLHKINNPTRNWDLGYWQSDTGTPGVMYSQRF